jgi:PTH1 family peptidyl-tRNA hydrolase
MAQQSPPWIVVGLGNPGDRYVATRHNIGEMVVDHLVDESHGRWKSSRKTRSDICQERWGDDQVVLARPHSFMNESGGPISSLMQFFGSSSATLVVLHDELDLPFGALRIKAGGGDNGHNGLRSARASLGTGEFIRVRVGIGRPPGRQDPADYVLRPFTTGERSELAEVVARAGAAVRRIVSDGVAAAQNQFNSGADKTIDEAGRDPK